MDRFVSYEKLSKSKKREQNGKKRRNWGSLNPATRKTASPKAYKRKNRSWESDDTQAGSFCFVYPWISTARTGAPSHPPYLTGKAQRV